MNNRPRTACPFDPREEPELAAAWIGGWIRANMERNMGALDAPDAPSR